MRTPVLAVGDGALGFWGALREVFPTTREQRCWFHKIANVLGALPKSAGGQPGRFRLSRTPTVSSTQQRRPESRAPRPSSFAHYAIWTYSILYARRAE